MGKTSLLQLHDIYCVTFRDQHGRSTWEIMIIFICCVHIIGAVSCIIFVFLYKSSCSSIERNRGRGGRREGGERSSSHRELKHNLR